MIVRSQTFVRCPSAIRKNSEKALLYGMPRAEKEGKIGAQGLFRTGFFCYTEKGLHRGRNFYASDYFRKNRTGS